MYYTSNQLALSAFLVTLGFEVIDCRPIPPKNQIVQFTFHDPANNILESVAAFDNAGVCAAKAFNGNIRKLRQMADAALAVGRG